jgi:hypothetical protein
VDVWVRLLSPVFHAPAGALPPNPVRMHLRTMHPIHFRKVGIGPFGLDRLPCATGLVSYPSSCLPFSRGRRRFRCLPLLGSYRASAVIAGLPAPPNRSTQSALTPPLFHLPAATPERFDGSLFVPNRRELNQHTGSQ